MGLLDDIAKAQDVQEELLDVPEWGVKILFRGMSFAALEAMKDIDLEKAQAGDMDQALRLVQATACDPVTKQPVFMGVVGEQVLRSKSYEVVLRILQQGALVVLGVDEAETAGKGSSSTAKAKKSVTAA